MRSQRQCRSAHGRSPSSASQADSGHNPLDNPLHNPLQNPLDDLRFIRETMERSNAFTAVPGWGQVVIGATALIAAYIAARQSSPSLWISTWLIEAGLALAISSVAMNFKSQRLGLPLVSGPARKFALGFLPPLVAGGFVTFILYRAGMVGSLPGVWAVIYGGAVISGGVLSVPLVPMMGACFMATGAVTLFFPAWGNWAMAASFGGLHILFGILIARKHGG